MNNEQTDIQSEIIDSLHVVSDCDIFGSDVELLSGQALPTAEEAAWRQAAPAEVFGTECVTAASTAHIADRHTQLSDSVPFQASVIILVIAYMTILLRSAGHVRAIIGAIFHSGGADPSIIEESDSAVMIRLMGGITLFSTLLSGIVMVKAADLILDADIAAAIPPVIRSASPLIATAAAAAIVLWQLSLHRTVAWVCQDNEIKRLGNITYIFFTAGALLLFPLTAMMLLGSWSISSVWVIISALGIGFVCILYLKETFMFFTSKKISILYWFLYLCSVIVLPVSLICLLAADLQ